MENTILRCENLHKTFGKKEILKGVSVCVNAGDILGFIGPNGAGKTTTIKLILGLQGITQGSVTINGFDVKKQFTKAIEKVGAIVENPDLYMYLSGLENLKLVAHLYKQVDEKRIQEVVKLVGLENRIKDKVSKYSLGMRQRLGVAQAILHKPNLLILDEPTNGLDPEGIKEMRELLKRLAAEENMAVFISSHNLAELESFCNKVCIIKNGMIVETSQIDSLKQEVTGERYILEVDQAQKVTELLQEVEVRIVDGTHVEVKVEKEQMPEQIKKLVLGNVRIYTAKQEEISLEEAFLRKTGGNIIE